MTTLTHCSYLRAFFCLLLFLPLSNNALFAETDAMVLQRTEAIGRAWAGHYVGFDLLHRGEHTFIGYYDANRQLTIAHRHEGTPWVYYKLDSWLGWDSHNYIEMELDDAGILHVLANMHNHRLEYFRFKHPYEVRSLRRVAVMATPELERAMTYPRFLRDKDGQLLLKYRDGSSGNGVEIYNRYNTATQIWTPLHRRPLIDGEGLMNAYVEGPRLGPDGYFHMIWVWRDTPDAATNHDLSYARSLDLLHWENAAGERLELPITIGTGDIVDPVPARGGMINGGARLGFDAQQRPVVAYHKYDEEGWTQIYVARFANGAWSSQKVTTWDGFRWDFGGTGSLETFEVRMQGVALQPDGTLGITLKKLGHSMRLIVDEDSLELLRTEPIVAYPAVLNKYASSDEVILDGGETRGPERIFRTRSVDMDEGAYILSWEAQAPNRGQARETITPPTTLRLHTFGPAEEEAR